MTMTISASPQQADEPANHLLQNYTLRQELGQALREARLAQKPVLTQRQLSEKLGYTYSIVTGWENGTRNILHKHFLELTAALNLDSNLVDGPLAIYKQVLLSDKKSAPNKGSRTEEGINARLTKLRVERNLSLREMALLIGMNSTQYFHLEHNHGNLTLGQLRLVSQRLGVTYEYLMDGTNEHDTPRALREQIKRLERENELLESFRQQVLTQH